LRHLLIIRGGCILRQRRRRGGHTLWGNLFSRDGAAQHIGFFRASNGGNGPAWCWPYFPHEIWPRTHRQGLRFVHALKHVQQLSQQRHISCGECLSPLAAGKARRVRTLTVRCLFCALAQVTPGPGSYEPDAKNIITSILSSNADKPQPSFRSRSSRFGYNADLGRFNTADPLHLEPPAPRPNISMPAAPSPGFRRGH
jgi:hypothetical protein